MPKMKSHSGAKKRFKKTSTGKWLHRKSGLRHLLTGMSAKRGRTLRTAKVEESTSSQGRLIADYLPYK
ncbi:MAG: 50S ribosomal protein L35 [Elusimicrobia bacterium RIFOXYA2_FULL_58_8]|nr:MAG: 50S ribosomal protein L35 [Elusimicrobia bacterium RIFOXYA12_FULL_57_11]OGS17278.1 MAG: 50S ribosomal protein L35 [Elusimicrobia bacterium RIFOXYA2_FULL_58_8]